MFFSPPDLLLIIYIFSVTFEKLCLLEERTKWMLERGRTIILKQLFFNFEDLKGKSTNFTHIKVSLLIMGSTNQPVRQLYNVCRSFRNKQTW